MTISIRYCCITEWVARTVVLHAMSGRRLCCANNSAYAAHSFLGVRESGRERVLCDFVPAAKVHFVPKTTVESENINFKSDSYDNSCARIVVRNVPRIACLNWLSCPWGFNERFLWQFFIRFSFHVGIAIWQKNLFGIENNRIFRWWWMRTEWKWEFVLCVLPCRRRRPRRRQDFQKGVQFSHERKLFLQHKTPHGRLCRRPSIRRYYTWTALNASSQYVGAWDQKLMRSNHLYYRDFLRAMCDVLAEWSRTPLSCEIEGDVSWRLIAFVGSRKKKNNAFRNDVNRSEH